MYWAKEDYRRPHKRTAVHFSNHNFVSFLFVGYRQFVWNCWGKYRRSYTHLKNGITWRIVTQYSAGWQLTTWKNMGWRSFSSENMGWQFFRWENMGWQFFRWENMGWWLFRRENMGDNSSSEEKWCNNSSCDPKEYMTPDIDGCVSGWQTVGFL